METFNRAREWITFFGRNQTGLGKRAYVPDTAQNIEIREQQVLETIQEIEVPLLTALNKEYSEVGGWHICHPASIAISRILSARTGIPIGRNLVSEHIDLTSGIFDPKNDPRRLSKIEAQAYVRYHLGNGDIYYIDPTYALITEGRNELKGAIKVEKYHVDELDAILDAKYSLYPYDPSHPDIEVIYSGVHYSAENLMRKWNDDVSAMNDRRGTYEFFVGDSGACGITSWHRVVEIIQQFAPNFTEDLEDRERHRLTVTRDPMVDAMLTDRMAFGPAYDGLIRKMRNKSF